MSRKQTPLCLLCTIVERGGGQRAFRTYEKHGIALHYRISGEGTASSDLLDLLGFGTSERDILISPARRSAVDALVEEIHRDGSHMRAKGILFVLPLTAASAKIAGALLGFLIYNFHPAKVFMGDTGSLFLGGAVAALAFAYDMPLILVTLGIMYIIEALSDIIQVGYFKLTHGKRVFKMSPFHHHLEMGGWTGHKWKETQIVALFAGVTVLFAVLSFIGVFHRVGV